MIILNLNNDTIYLKLSDSLLLKSISKMKVQLFSLLESYNNINIDLSSVKEIDISGYQLLNLLKREAEKTNKTVSITKKSNNIKNFIYLYNHNTFFNFREFFNMNY